VNWHISEMYGFTIAERAKNLRICGFAIAEGAKNLRICEFAFPPLLNAYNSQETHPLPDIHDEDREKNPHRSPICSTIEQ
jgi:hypothetical protein